MKRKVALITGITGQDGSLLAKFLLKKDYIVHGIIRRSSSFNTGRLDSIYKDFHEKDNKLFLHYGDLLDTSSTLNILEKSNPDEIYNLAAQSHVKVSFELPEYTAQVDALGTLRLLEGIRILNLIKKVKFYQASTSEMFGSANPPQSEKTEMLPASPYGAAKLYAHWITKNYREAYNIFASTGILFNHEGPYRGETFVTQKIVTGAVNIYKKNINKIYLGNLDAKRDWGDARDFVRGMWLILQHKVPDDFVLATGKSITVREFANKVFKKLNLHLVWNGKKENEKGLCKKTGKILIEIDKKYYRPNEVNFLLGNPSKAKKILKWKPLITLDSMINDMINFKLNN
jgi:GDPmannose 4,6-dehydratase